jgi:hypothetical protein
VRSVNAEIERAGIEYVMRLEREAGRRPEDVHLQGFPNPCISGNILSGPAR